MSTYKSLSRHYRSSKSLAPKALAIPTSSLTSSLSKADKRWTMEDEKLIRLHDVLSQLRPGGKKGGLGFASGSGRKGGKRSDGLPNNGLYAMFVRQGEGGRRHKHWEEEATEVKKKKKKKKREEEVQRVAVEVGDEVAMKRNKKKKKRKLETGEEQVVAGEGEENDVVEELKRKKRKKMKKREEETAADTFVAEAKKEKKLKKKKKTKKH